jgi:NTP pyrophosphatase (non-canonical NTP hydrolase)
VSKSIAKLQKEIHDLAVEKGWWTDVKTQEPVNPEDRIPEAIALIHSELSEALEEYRRGLLAPYAVADGKPEGFGIELADAVIRIMDLCGALNIDLEERIDTKHKYNKTRPYRHGNKRA